MKPIGVPIKIRPDRAIDKLVWSSKIGTKS
jgi:hypothetical protein